MIEKIIRKAEEYKNKHWSDNVTEMSSQRSFQQVKGVPHFYDNAIKQAYVVGAIENGIQWHDLRKNPNDLPEADCKNWVLAVYDNGTLWCRARREVFADGVYWVNSFHHTIENVVLWAKIEIPQFKE